MINHMSEQHEEGLGPVEPIEVGAWETGPKLEVRVKTDDIDVRAVPMHTLPHLELMNMLMMPEPYQTVKKMALFKLSIHAEDEASVELATFGEMWNGMNTWTSVSNAWWVKNYPESGMVSLKWAPTRGA